MIVDDLEHEHWRNLIRLAYRDQKAAIEHLRADRPHQAQRLFDDVAGRLRTIGEALVPTEKT